MRQITTPYSQDHKINSFEKYAAAAATIISALIAAVSLNMCSSQSQKAPDKAITTTGALSPIITASGNVTLNYGIPPSFLNSFAATMRAAGSSEREVALTLERVSTNLQNLQSELTRRSAFDPVALKLLQPLTRGDFVQAEEILLENRRSLITSSSAPSSPALPTVVSAAPNSTQIKPLIATSIEGQHAIKCSGQNIGGNSSGYIHPDSMKSWIEISPARNFRRGDCLRFVIEGSARSADGRTLSSFDENETQYLNAFSPIDSNGTLNIRIDRDVTNVRLIFLETARDLMTGVLEGNLIIKGVEYGSSQ